MKKLVCVLTLAFGLGGFVGCGGGVDNSASAPDKPDPKPPGGPSSAGPAGGSAPAVPPPPTAPAPPPPGIN